MKKSKLIVFDIDGTLVDSVAGYHQVIINAMTDMGLTTIDPNFNVLKHHTDSYALKFNYEKNFTADFSMDLLDRFEDLIVQYLLKQPETKPIKGANEFILQLQDTEYGVAFATGSLPESALLKMNQAGVWIDEALLATSKTSLSREGFVLEAIERAKKYYQTTTFDQVISVGDGIWDLKTAQNLNLEFVGIGHKNKSILEENGMVNWIEDFSANQVSQIKLFK